MVKQEISEIIGIEELEYFDDEYVYDIGVDDNSHFFFANDILVHNSCYFSVWPMIEDQVKSGQMEWNVETAIALYDQIAEEVNINFPEHMERDFRCPTEYGKLIKCGREVVGSTALFITKKRYAMIVVDDDGKRQDIDGKPGKLKAMGLDLKRADTAPIVQDFLKDILNDTLLGKDKEEIIKKILDFKKMFNDLPPWDKGAPKRINNLTKYTIMENNAKRKGETARLPGHVRAGYNYNNLRKMNGDNFTMAIEDGSKAIICKLKNNPLGITSIARPTDEHNIPQWFKDLPFDDDEMSASVIDKKVDNLLGVLGWDLDVHTDTSSTFGSLFEF